MRQMSTYWWEEKRPMRNRRAGYLRNSGVDERVNATVNGKWNVRSDEQKLPPSKFQFNLKLQNLTGKSSRRN